MTDRQVPPDEPRDADELTASVSDLGSTADDRLDEVEKRNESLEERLPSDDDLPRTHGATGEATPRTGSPAEGTPAEATPGKGTPGKGTPGKG